MTPSRSRFFALPLLVFGFLFSPHAHASTNEKVIHFFRGQDGANPAALLSDSAGNLYGLTSIGGDSTNTTCSSAVGNGCGTVFQLTLQPQGVWKQTILYRFSGGRDGRAPKDLAIDAAGNLYGIAQQGGDSTGCSGGHGCGTIFELIPTSKGWHFSRLHSFTGGQDGATPSSIAVDAGGNIYVAAEFGGNTDCGGLGCGTIFRLKSTSVGWKPSTIVVFDWTFTNQQASNPLSKVIFDARGNLYGVAGGGTYNDWWSATFGTVYELTPTSSGQWTETVLYSFCPGPTCTDGAAPIGGITFDSSDNIVGTTSSGGSFDMGAVFQLTPSSGTWSESVLYSFTGGGDGGIPVASPSFDQRGNLFGTTAAGGNPNCSCGILFRLTPNQGTWTQSVIHSFTGVTDGAYPGTILLNGTGNLFGTTAFGGLNASPCSLLCGVAFEFAAVASATDSAHPVPPAGFFDRH